MHTTQCIKQDGSAIINLEPSVAATLANGLNSNVPTQGSRVLTTSSPTGAFSIDGFVAGADGDRLQFINLSGQALTIVNNGGGSTAGNKIFTQSGNNMTLPCASTCTADFRYSTAQNGWLLTAMDPQNESLASGQLGFFQTAIVAAVAAGSATTQNQIRLYPIFLSPALISTKMAYIVGAADNTANSYDAGLYGPGCLNGAAGIPLAAHFGTTAGTSFAPATGTRELAWSGAATISLAPGWYCWAFTSSAASPAFIPNVLSTSYQEYVPFATTSIAGGGASLPATITAPALSWQVTSAAWIALHN